MAERLLVPQPLRRPPADTCQLYLVRHGTTALGCHRGRRDVPLDAQGYRDAYAAAERLAYAGLSAVYTGPLRRTITTAQIIAETAGVPDVRILAGLNNLDYGAWEGLNAQEAALLDPEAYARYQSAPAEAVCPMGEGLSDAQQRIIAALQLIGSRHTGEAVAAVTHAVMIRLVLMTVNRVEDESWRLSVSQGAVTELWLRNDAISLALSSEDGNR